MNTRLQAVQHIRRMRGGSQPHLIRASDGAYYVTKFTNNPQHIRVLANEMFASRIARYLGLPVPQVEPIEVSDWLIQHTPELSVQLHNAQFPCSSGLQFGSLYGGHRSNEFVDVFDYLPESLLGRAIGLRDFARMLVFDKWLGNSDGRQAVFTRRHRARKYRVLFIDHGYCFNAGEWSFADSPMRGVYARNLVYAEVTGWESFEPALTKAEEMDLLELWRCAEQIPPAWYENDSAELSRVVEALYERRGLIRSLIHGFRTSSRNPFPSWRGVS